MSSAEKEKLRAQVREAGRALSDRAKREASRRLQERVLALPEYAAARVVSLYAPFPSEPDTERLFAQARAAGKRVVFPGYASGGPDLRELSDLADLREGSRGGLRHPPPGPAVPPEQVDVFVVPGMAFDRAGRRLGRGQGFYDRLLAKRGASSTAVGVCFDHALVEPLEVEPHDLPVDYVATPSELFERPGRKR